MMIRACSPASASASWAESLSIRATTPVRVLELVDRLLELAVEDHPVGDDDDLVEDRLVVGVVERLESRCASQAIVLRLARAGRVLDEVASGPAPSRASVGLELADRVPLVVAREDDRARLELRRRASTPRRAIDVDEAARGGRARRRAARPRSHR